MIQHSKTPFAVAVLLLAPCAPCLAQLEAEKPQQAEATKAEIAPAARGGEARPRVLVIASAEDRESADFLVDLLRKHSVAVDVRFGDLLFKGLDELKPYAAVILADVPRDAEQSRFTDEHIRMLVRNTRELGRGLVLIGGPNSFGAGGWANTELERASPVRFASPFDLSGALVLIIDDWQAPDSTTLQRRAAKEAMRPLGAKDHFDLIYSTGASKWLDGEGDGIWPIGERRDMLLKRIEQLVPGEMESLDESLDMAIQRLGKTTSVVRHIVVVSDGSPKPPSDETLRRLGSNRVKVSSIAMGTGSPMLQQISVKTGGAYYVAKNAEALPRICRREARFVLQPHRFEPRDPVEPKIVARHAILTEIGENLPPITGLIATTLKKDGRVELVLAAAAGKHELPLLAVRQYGKGRVAVLTTDTGKRWARAWTSRKHRETVSKFLYQLTRWSMAKDPGEDRD